MCEITCENFYSELPVIEDAIRKCAFISLDMEFSKLFDNVSKPFTLFDTTEERYNKLHQKVSDITCIQLGIAIYIYDAKNKIFETKTYSFYTYPQTFYKSDSVVKFQTSCVEFLCKHNFDFNKLFHNRVPYLTDKEELKIKSEMLDELFFDKYFETNIKFRPIEEELMKILKIVSEWYDTANYGEQTFLEINGCNEPAYIILMQYYVLKKLKYILIDENQLGLTITKIEVNTNSEILNRTIYENLKLSLLNKMMGIKYLMKLISKLKKPIIGHNCALDILILSNQFFTPLPENFKDFQHFVSNNFGPIYDTKLLCKEVKRIVSKNDKWLGSSLSEIYSYLKDGDGHKYADTICIQLTGIEEPQDMKLHHAGWDAYYTGYCFVKMIHIIKSFSCKTENTSTRYTLIELFKSIEFSKNKLFTSRSISNILDLEADGRHYQTNYLIIQNKGILYKALDLKKLKQDLKQICIFDIKLLSKYTALVAFPFMHSRIIYKLKTNYKVENYSIYQRKKTNKQIIGLSLAIITTCVTIIKYLRK
ncbi:PREDICTED: poly(A)-specific ribonuclease PARN-like [Diuraphis noxia]|uniref:poly(A)-specific ribonuclease PARN-like n=1 Tax=Diuraphis noxia TaxID=143948 RepID=UPI00076363D5|nr:PREDICTED: poly(A)-specific ribonuclease PARN-like [Diuraphis noxia]